jgi:hypothetical protein
MSPPSAQVTARSRVLHSATAYARGMRETCVCPKCRHDHVLLIESVPDRDDSPSGAQMHVAKVIVGEGWLGPKIAYMGKLSAFVCRRCGYTELYAADPERIPVDGHGVRELVGKKPDGPFR